MSRSKDAKGMNFRTAPAAAVLLSAALAGAPAFAAKPLDRAALTKGLVPVTGEKTRSLDLTVPFARDSAKLTEAARAQLAELAAALSGEKLRRFRVEGKVHDFVIYFDKSGKRVASGNARNGCFEGGGYKISNGTSHKDCGFK